MVHHTQRQLQHDRASRDPESDRDARQGRPPPSARPARTSARSDLVQMGGEIVVRDITFNARDEKHGQSVVEALNAASAGVHASCTSPTARSSCTSAARSRCAARSPVKTRDDLSMAYTPGVARVCMAHPRGPGEGLHADRSSSNTVAVVSDGTAVLGLGDIGPRRRCR